MRGKWLMVAMVVAAATAGAGARVSAQQAGFAGAWIMEYPSRITNEGGVETVDMGHARMTLQQHGDSLSGEWRSTDPAPDGKPAPVRVMRGTVKATHASLETTAEAHMNRGGEESTMQLTVRYELDLAGDAVSGMQSASMADGTALGPSRQVTGKRAPAGS